MFTITNVRRGRSTPQNCRSNSIVPNTMGVTYATVYDDGTKVYDGTLENCKGFIEMRGFS